ncbi:hypothetical protein ABN199_11550, partial [Klebsiella pneumoniae]
MRNVKIDEFDRLDRDVVALGNDYAQGFILPPHQHRRAQLLYGATGLMYVTTQDGGHCCKVSDEAAFCLIQRPYISKTLLTRRISPR